MGDLGATVEAAQAGDREAFDELVRQTYDDTFSLALRLTGNCADAEDVAQDTYLRAFRGLARFRGDSSFGTWLYRITSNCASSLVSRRPRAGVHEVLDDDTVIVDERPDHDPSARMEAADLRERLVEAVGQLPAKLRSVIVLRDIYDLSHEAIARQLGITETAAKVRLHRAREKLRSQLHRDRTDAAALTDRAAPVGPGVPSVSGVGPPGHPGAVVEQDVAPAA